MTMILRPLCLPAAAVAALLLAGCGTPTKPLSAEVRGSGLAQADAWLQAADRMVGQDEAAAACRLHAAEIAWEELRDRTGKVTDVTRLPQSQQHALQVLATCAEELAPLFVGNHAAAERTFLGDGQSYRVIATRTEKQGVVSPERILSVKPAAKVPRSRKLMTQWHVESGAGAPLSPAWKVPADRRMWRFVRARGFLSPLTAVLDFTGPAKPGGTRTATLTTYDPTVVRAVRVGRAEYPLAADFTAPIVDHTHDINEFVLALRGLLHADVTESNLTLLEPYDPKRVPVLLIHGLNSHPRMWRNVVNDLRADPDLRGRYQYWVFWYPTGAPVAYSALRLREELAALDKTIGPQHRMVLIGHSMGGLVARLQAISPGRAIWNAQMRHEADHLYATQPADSLLKRTMLFQANPEIGREIYICVPHRGSGLADLSLAAWFGKLVRLPGRITSGLAAIPAAAVSNRPLNSINSLSPHNPLYQALDQVPIQVPHHSIIGDRGKGGNRDKTKPQSSDGVVPYWSSHLASAQSELVVPGPHGSHERPDTIAEIKRILKLHARN